MSILTKLYIQRLLRQKFIYIFFLCFLTASGFYAFLISTPQMESMLNVNLNLVGGGNFPEFMMRFYVGTVGILFVAFLITFYICEEDRNRILYQPLLHGQSRSSIVKAKIVVYGSMSFLFVILIGCINYVMAFMRWGQVVLDTAIVIRVAVKYLLSGMYMVSLTIAIVALCIWTRSTLKTVVTVILYILVDSFICGMNSVLPKSVWIGYYPDTCLFLHEYQKIPLKIFLLGGIVMAAYSLLFYRIAMDKIEKINF